MDHVQRGRVGQGRGHVLGRKEAALKPIQVQCTTCIRTELWDGEQKTVVEPGGKRRPYGDPRLAAWITLKASSNGEIGPIVGRCDACDQPMAADGEAAPIVWTLELPDGTLEVVGTQITEAGAPVDPKQADKRIRRHFGEPLEPGKALFSTAVLGVMIGPLLLWATTFFMVFWFLYNVMRGTFGV